MNLTETYHSEDMHARWSHARRYVIMTRAVSIILLLTSGIMMHTALMKTGGDVLSTFNQSSTIDIR
ncbi:MAG: hypothetical protein WA790_07180 [Sulfitobacter sp.]